MHPVVRALAVAATVVVAGLTLPGAANASPPAAGEPTAWTSLVGGFCLAPRNGSMAPGTDIILWTCTGGPDQAWVSDPVSSEEVVIRNNQDRGTCISVAAMSLTNNAKLVLWNCKEPADNQDQRWFQGTSRAPETTTFQNANSHLWLGARDGWAFNGAQVAQIANQSSGGHLWFGSGV